MRRVRLGSALVVAILLTPAVYAIHAFVVRVLRIEPEAHEPRQVRNLGERAVTRPPG